MSEKEIKIIDPEAAKMLQGFVSRVEALESEKKGLMEDIREVWKEAKDEGFDVPTMKDILKRRQKSERELEEAEYLLSAYESALDGKIKGAELPEE